VSWTVVNRGVAVFLCAIDWTILLFIYEQLSFIWRKRQCCHVSVSPV